MQPILKIDINSGKTEVLDIPRNWEAQFIGGSSLAARFLYNHLVQEMDPLSPDSPRLFMTGPLTGTSGPSVGRYVICGRSPGTGLWAESNCGGFWGPELRKTGYDGLWIDGKAENPLEKEVYRMTGDSNTVYIGRKPTMSYVLAVITNFSSSDTKEVTIKARGRAITTAVDVAEIVNRRFMKELKVGEITTGTEEIKLEEGGTKNVSTIEIKLARG